MNCDTDPILEFVRIAGLEHDVAIAEVTLNAKLDTVLACTDLHRLTKFLEVLHDFQEFSRWHLHKALVRLFWNLHMFALDLHELQVEFCDLVLRAALSLETDMISTIVRANLQRVLFSTHLEDFGKGVD